MAEYKYYIGTTEVFPLDNKSSKIVYEKSIPSAVKLDTKMDAALSFKSTGSFNFKAQQEIDPTVELDFIIRKKRNGFFEDFVKLVFTVGEGDFDDDQCTFSVKTKSTADFRKDIKVNIIIKQNLINPVGSTPGVFFRNVLSNPTDDRRYDQAFYFDKTVLSIAQQSNPKIKGLVSNFFQINPDVVSADALPGVPNMWMNMAFASLSDIQEPVPSDKARFEFLTFQELMDDLNTLFDVNWIIDASGNLRIEHRTYFDGILGLDLTAQRYKNYTVATSKYNYDLSDFPRTETMKIANSKQYATFTNGYFATINNNNNEVVKETKKINTDLTNIIYFGGSSTNEGVFLFACGGVKTDTSFAILSNLQTGEDYDNLFKSCTGQNVYLTPHYLFKYIHLYGRYDSGSFFESSTVTSAGNDNDPVFYVNGQIRAGGIKHKSVRPIILQKKFTIPLCENDVFEGQNYVKTQMGYGLPQSASFDMNSELLELELKYPAPEYKFDPTQIYGLQLWLRGEKGITFTGADITPGVKFISRWKDYSGNGRDAVGTSGTYPYNSTSRSYGIIVGGAYAGAQLVVPAFQLFPNKRGTIFILYKTEFDASTPRDGNLISTHDGAAGRDYDISIRNTTAISWSEFSANIFPQNLFTDYRLLQVKRYADDMIIGRDNSRDVPNYQEYAPGVPVLNPLQIDNVNYAVKDIVIGNNLLTGADGSAVINIMEVIIYDHDLSEVDCERVELYLAKRGYYKPGTIIRENF